MSCFSIKTSRDFEQIDAWAKEHGQTAVFAPWHPKPEFRIFKTGSLMRRNELYPSGLILVTHQGVPVPWKKITTMEDVTDIKFKECEVHTMIRYAGDKCPVCAASEAREEALGRVEYEKTQLEGTVAALEERLQGYKDELRL